MSDRGAQILNAAEKHIRHVGYNGFSFRDIAAEVGVKSASIHHHFPTKSALAVAVARRYGERFFEQMEGVAPADLTRSYTEAFRRSLIDGGLMCPFGVLAAEAGALPPEVIAESRYFFGRAVELLTRALEPASPSTTAARNEALRIVAVLEGAMILARALDDLSVFDSATTSIAGV